MNFIRSRDVLALTGLTSDQLREWTGRRAFVTPDIPPQKRGSEAKFSWQSVLLLRLAVVLRTRFHVELQAHRELLLAARALLNNAAFPGLWGTTLAIYGLRRCELLPTGILPPSDEDVILLRLNPHLEVLSEGLGHRDPISQLPLFPAVGLSTSEPVVLERTSLKASRP